MWSHDVSFSVSSWLTFRLGSSPTTRLQFGMALPEAISTRCVICTICEQPAVDGWFVAAADIKKKVRCHACLNLSRLGYGCPMLHSGSSLALPFTY